MTYVKKSATISHVLTSIGILITALVFAGGLIYTSYSRSQVTQDKAAEKVEAKADKNTEDLVDVRLNVNTIQNDIQHIKGDIKESKDIQQKILDKLNEN